MSSLDWLTVAAIADLPCGVGVFLRQRNRTDGRVARRHGASGKAGQSERLHRQPAAGDPRADARRAAVRKQSHQYRRLDLGDRRIARVLRQDRRDLCHAGHDGADFRGRRSAAEDRRLQFAGPHGARGSASGRSDGALVVADADRRRVAGPCHSARHRHAGRQDPIDPFAARGTARHRRHHASRRRRGKARPRHDGGLARPARARGFGRHGPSHQDGDARRRRAAAGRSSMPSLPRP